MLNFNLDSFAYEEVLNMLNNLHFTDKVGKVSDMIFLSDDWWLRDTAVIENIVKREGMWEIHLVFAHYQEPCKLIKRVITRHVSKEKVLLYAQYMRRLAAKDQRGNSGGKLARFCFLHKLIGKIRGMPDLNTKQKILNSAVRLFNEHGLTNVRLQHIANDIGISVGNLAYHFRNKEAIVSALCDQIEEEISEVLSNYRIFPNLIDFDNQLSKYFSFLAKYPFYSNDLIELERNYPKMYAKHKCLIDKMISQLHKRFDYKQKREVLKPESPKGIYKIVANSIWVLIFFWIPQNNYKGRKVISQGGQIQRTGLESTLSLFYRKR